jgi:hypothetical protein
MDKKKFPLLSLVFFTILLLFPTFRVLVMGSLPALSVSDFLLAALPEIFFLLYLLINLISYYRSPERIRLKTFDFLIITYFVYNVVTGFILAADVKISLYGFRLTYLPMLMYFIFRVQAPEQAEKALKYLGYLILALGIVGILLYFFFAHAMMHMLYLTELNPQSYFIIRMTSILWTPVVFSTFIAAGFLYFLYRYYSSGKWWLLIILSILVFCMIMAMSRGVFIAILLSFIFISLLMRAWKRALVATFLIAIVFLITTFYISSPNQVLSFITESTVSTVKMEKSVNRVHLWQQSFANFSSHPFGYGLGKAGHVAARFFSPGTSEADIYSTDGWYLKLMNETGLPALIFYLVIAAFFLILYLKRFGLRKNVAISVYLLSFFVFVNIQNMVSNVLDFYLFPMLFWGIVGMMATTFYKPAV